MSQLSESFVIVMDGREVVVWFTPSNESPFRQVDTGNASITVDGVTRDYAYTKTSFVPLPFQWLQK